MLNKRNGRKYIYGSPFKKLEDFFTVPFESRALRIYIAVNDFLPSKLYPIESVMSKMFALRYAGDFEEETDYDSDDDEIRVEKTVLVPLVHTLK